MDYGADETTSDESGVPKDGASLKAFMGVLPKLSDDQLAKVQKAVDGEMKRREKEEKKNQKPGSMNEKEFNEWSRRALGDKE